MSPFSCALTIIGNLNILTTCLNGQVKKNDDSPPKTADQPVPTGDGSPQAQQEDGGKNPAAVALGRLGGLKGGKARAKKLSAKQRSEIAKRAAQARWRKAK